MKFSADHYFHIGQTHLRNGKPCQDHALSRSFGEAACAVVSDGCSTGEETDMGARILTFSLVSALEEHWARTHSSLGEAIPGEVNMRQQIVLGGVQSALKLSHQDTLATCMYAYLSWRGGFVHVRGDGVIASMWRNGQIGMTRLDWQNNTPFYPAYAADDYAAFIHAHGGNICAVAMTEEEWTWTQYEGSKEKGKREIALNEGIRGITLALSPQNILDLQAIAVFTDGVTQVDGVDWKDAVVRLLSFKNNAGEFAKRRMIRFLKEVGEVGKGPSDDISYSVIILNHEEE